MRHRQDAQGQVQHKHSITCSAADYLANKAKVLLAILDVAQALNVDQTTYEANKEDYLKVESSEYESSRVFLLQPATLEGKD